MWKKKIHKLCYRWDCVMLLCAVIASLIQFALHLVQIFHFAIGESLPQRNRASSMLYSWCDTGICNSFASCSLRGVEPPTRDKDFKLWFFSSRALFHCTMVQFLCTLTYWSLLTLLCFLNRGFWLQFCHIGELQGVFSSLWMLTHFFHDIGPVVQWCLEQ